MVYNFRRGQVDANYPPRSKRWPHHCKFIQFKVVIVYNNDKAYGSIHLQRLFSNTKQLARLHILGVTHEFHTFLHNMIWLWKSVYIKISLPQTST